MGNTLHGFRFPDGPEAPDVPLWNSRLANDAEQHVYGPYGCVGLDANQGPVSATTVFVGGWVSRYVRNGMTANANGLVVPVAGIYRIDAWARFQVSAAATVRLIVGNGAGPTVIADAYATQHATLTYNATPYVSRVLSLPAGDQIRCGFVQSAASVVTMVGGATQSGLSVELLEFS